jgi:hypothetical protein
VKGGTDAEGKNGPPRSAGPTKTKAKKVEILPRSLRSAAANGAAAPVGMTE